MRIAVLGSGPLGSTLAAAWAQAGHEVTIGSRRPREVSAPVPVAAVHEAASTAEVVVSAVPGRYALATFTAQPAGWLDGRVLLDVSNPDDGTGAVADTGSSSVAEQLQAAFPRTSVVKALNTFSRTVMVDPCLLPEPTTVFVSGDHADAKHVVVELLADFGWERDQILDLGALRTARAAELMIPMYYAIRDALGTRDFNYRVVVARASDPIAEDSR